MRSFDVGAPVDCLNSAGFLPKVDGMHMSPSPGEPGGQGYVHPQENGGPRENGEEEDRLAAKNRPEDVQIPDSGEPGPIDQEVTRQAQYDEAGHDDYDTDRDASSWHYPASLLCSPSSRPSDRVGLGAGRGWKGAADSLPARSPTSAAMGSPG